MNGNSKPSGQSVLIMAGGTGGHIYPGLAVAAVLEGQGVAVHWLGARGGMECQKVPQAGIALQTVEIGGLRGKGLVSWLTAPLQLARAVFHAFKIVGQMRPACALSFGGYAAGPGGLAARLRGVPLLVHEQNRICGLTNRVLAHLATSVMQAFPGTWSESLQPVTCGNPVRSDVVGLPPPEERLAHRSGPLRVLVTGGSQGARALNEILPEALGMLAPTARPQVRHQAGSGAATITGQRYREQGMDVEVIEFIDDISASYAWADLVICRAGALTVSELAAAGIGAILVPYPFAVDDHQTRNAAFLCEVGAALIVQESELDAASLAGLIGELSVDRSRLRSMASAARSVAVPDSASKVAEICTRIGRIPVEQVAAA